MCIRDSKNGSLLEEGSVIGSDVVIGAGSTINPNVRIWPNKEVEPGAVVHESIIWAGSWKRGLFTSFGLNGLINIEITPEFASRLGAAIGALTPKGTEIAFSRDYTRSARMIGRPDVWFDLGRDKCDRPVGAARAGKPLLGGSQPPVLGARANLAGRPAIR